MTQSVFTADALAGEIVLVTGASRGIGAAILDVCVKAGATVIGTATSDSGAAKISARIQELGGKGEGRVLNIAAREGTDAFMKALEADFGSVTVLVNNAGITRDTLSMRMKDSQWDEVIETNLTGGFRLSRACLKGMMKARPSFTPGRAFCISVFSALEHQTAAPTLGAPPAISSAVRGFASTGAFRRSLATASISLMRFS